MFPGLDLCYTDPAQHLINGRLGSRLSTSWSILFICTTCVSFGKYQPSTSSMSAQRYEPGHNAAPVPYDYLQSSGISDSKICRPPTKQWPMLIIIRPFCVRDSFFLGCKQRFFCFQVSFCPVKRGNRAGSSRNESDYSRRGTQISFPLLESRSCDNFGLAHFSIV